MMFCKEPKIRDAPPGLTHNERCYVSSEIVDERGHRRGDLYLHRDGAWRDTTEVQGEPYGYYETRRAAGAVLKLASLPQNGRGNAAPVIVFDCTL